MHLKSIVFIGFLALTPLANGAEFYDAHGEALVDDGFAEDPETWDAPAAEEAGHGAELIEEDNQPLPRQNGS